MTIGGANANDFVVTPLSITSLDGNSSVPLEITFDPSGAGPRTATVSIVSNDQDENPFTFDIQGEGNTPLVPSPPPTSASDGSTGGVGLTGLAGLTGFDDGAIATFLDPPSTIQGFSSLVAQETFTVRNPSAIPFQLGNILIGENANLFRVIPPTATISSGETATFTLQVADDILPGTYATTIIIPNNTGPSLTFDATAVVSLPKATDLAPIFNAIAPSDSSLVTQGDDVLIGTNIDGDGRQWLNGGAGNDQIFGNLDRDVITGGPGNDSLFGGQGDDWMKGAAGDDVLAGDFGDDTLIGGAGSDHFIIGAGRGSDEILDYSDGIDGFLLETTLTFDQLTFEASGNSTVIKFGNETLATVLGVERSLLDGADFAPLG